MNIKKLVLTAFSICIAFSILLTIITCVTWIEVKRNEKIEEIGRGIVETVLRISIAEKEYRLNPYKEIKVEHLFKKLRAFISSCEKTKTIRKLNESVDLYEKLFEQLKFYYKTKEKIIEELRKSETLIQATIFSKLRPERGTIALLEIRLQERNYMLFRNKPLLFSEKSYPERREIAVRNLKMWAEGDKRINELLDKSNQLFEDIMSNYKKIDNTIRLMQEEMKKVENFGYYLCELSQKKIQSAFRKLKFLLTALSAILIMGGIELVVLHKMSIL